MPGSSGDHAELGDARRPLVDREERADAVAGAVVEVEARLPERGRASVSSCAPVAPTGKRAVAMAMWPLSTRVKRSRISAVGVPMATVRVMSVVPSRYWRAGIDQVEVRPAQRAAGWSLAP